MKQTIKIFTTLLFALNVMPGLAAGPELNLKEELKNTTKLNPVAENMLKDALDGSENSTPSKSVNEINKENKQSYNETKKQIQDAERKEQRAEKKAERAEAKQSEETKIETKEIKELQSEYEDDKPTDTRSDEQKAKDMQEKRTAYETAHDNEQSRENRLLTAATTAATGIGGMELAQGLSEQNADKTAEQSMSAYIATMRCKYGDTQVKAGLEEIELPGGNDSEMAKYRTEYFALATDLKERKNAMGIKPGIESIEVLDKSTMGLYDNETVGINDGTYASLYRAQMYDSENDKAKINDAKETSKTRVIAGAAAAGIGVVGGMVGDQMINRNLGKKINIDETISVLDKHQIVDTLSETDIQLLFENKNQILEGDIQ